MAALKPVSLVSGDTWLRAWSLRDAAGAAIDLTGAVARLQVRDAAGLLVAQASTADGRLVIAEADGRIAMNLPAAAMTLAAGSYRYALEVTFADGTVRTVEINTLAILPDVTHD